MKGFRFETDMLNIFGSENNIFLAVENVQSKSVFSLEAPVFEINGQEAGGKELRFIRIDKVRELLNGGREARLIYEVKGDKGTELAMYLRYFPDSPFIRYKYELSSNNSVKLTKSKGKDNIRYTGFSGKAAKPELTEIQFSHFLTYIHSYNPVFDKKSAGELEAGSHFPGPIAFIEEENCCSLLAYEHGAEYPDTYLAFDVKESDGVLQLGISAEKGNYYNGEFIGGEHRFVSPWFHFAVCAGGRDEMLRHYRTFFLKYICENQESRKPYIFYNTWNYQERNRDFNGSKFLDSMHADRIMAEIDVAYRMGVEVYVIDTGWFIKTGDWQVNLERFPCGLKKVKEKLDGYGMKLGLWFNPTAAARTSEIVLAHPEYVKSVNGKSHCGPVWETEESYGMCLASGYSDYFIKKMIDLNKELGVSYFKWDGIGQYDCDSPLHNHGTEENSPQERQQCFSFKMAMEMIRIVEEVTRECPEVIVDFDVTEGGRNVGLGFLSVGKYFLVNNGPYAMDFDLPENYIYEQKEPIWMDPWTNMFFYPGAARPRFCRQGIKYDSFVPSILFLTHYFPDKPLFSQNNSIASLMLGGNGIWGDLLELTEDDIKLFYDNITNYKKVAQQVTESYPVVKGLIGSSPEIYEKIDHSNAKGIVCFFTKAAGQYTYITDKIDTEKLSAVEGADSYEVLPGGRLKLTVTLSSNDARVVYVL
jgi:alpha-galactosidase